ncbi:hypothetical protein T10_9100 [Trichinella papuae]|uniref:Uncharacterized protein n=1 Tax=Trichinella papuae TaxID=268474 RepID=A0A0V1MA59_9BILA|nr:hypothetical protein T10_9100 [Trichinella papuae]
MKETEFSLLINEKRFTENEWIKMVSSGLPMLATLYAFSTGMSYSSISLHINFISVENLANHNSKQ